MPREEYKGPFDSQEEEDLSYERYQRLRKRAAKEKAEAEEEEKEEEEKRSSDCRITGSR